MSFKQLKKTLKTAFDLLPVPVRFGSEFRKMYAFLQKSEQWNLEALQEYQIQKIRQLVTHAGQNVPYYQQLFEKWGFEFRDIRDFKDFRKIPLLDKETVKSNLQTLLSVNYPPAKRVFLTTGGSTGTPMGFFRSRNAYRSTLAFEWRNYNWNGCQFGDKVAILRSQVIEPGFSRFNRTRNALLLSAHKMTDANLLVYLKMLDQFRPKFILAYPSAIELLAQFIFRQRNSPQFLKTLKGIFTSSESLFPEQKLLIESSLNTRVFDKYGNSEMVTMIGMCEQGRYHDFMEYSYTEILDETGNPVTEDGAVGELVGTAFVNEAMPLIRYRTGDQVVVSREACPCGRAHTVIKSILGREKEVIVARDLSRLPLAPVLFGIHDERWHQIRRIQFVQEKPGELTILAETTNSDLTEMRSYLGELFSQRLKENFNFEIQIVEQIPLTERGKFKYLVQKMMV